MAVDKTRFGEYMQKKSICLFAAPVKFGTEDKDIGTASENYLMAKLPPEAVIVNAYVHVETAADSVTSADLTLGTTDGGAEILSGVDLKTVGEQGTFVAQSLTGTGKDLYMNVAIVGTTTNVGKFIVVVEYVEYEKNTGEYTEISRY